MSILQKRSLVAGVLPTTASLLAGELGINVPDGRVFLRKSGSGSDTIQSAITTGAQNSGSVTLSGSLALYGTSGSVLSVASDTLEFNGDQMELTGSFGVSGSMKVTGSFAVAGGLSLSSGSLEVIGDWMEFTGSFIVTGSMTVTGSLNAPNITGSLFGTASRAVSSSFAITSSYSSNGFPFSGSAVISGSLSVSGSINIDGGTY